MTKLALTVGGRLDGDAGPLRPHQIPRDHVVLLAGTSPDCQRGVACVMFTGLPTPLMGDTYRVYELSAESGLILNSEGYFSGSAALEVCFELFMDLKCEATLDDLLQMHASVRGE